MLSIGSLNMQGTLFFIPYVAWMVIDVWINHHLRVCRYEQKKICTKFGFSLVDFASDPLALRGFENPLGHGAERRPERRPEGPAGCPRDFQNPRRAEGIRRRFPNKKPEFCKYFFLARQNIQVTVFFHDLILELYETFRKDIALVINKTYWLKIRYFALHPRRKTRITYIFLSYGYYTLICLIIDLIGRMVG